MQYDIPCNTMHWKILLSLTMKKHSSCLQFDVNDKDKRDSRKPSENHQNALPAQQYSIHCGKKCSDSLPTHKGSADHPNYSYLFC
jgi:hypothetical protein